LKSTADTSAAEQSPYLRGGVETPEGHIAMPFMAWYKSDAEWKGVLTFFDQTAEATGCKPAEAGYKTNRPIEPHHKWRGYVPLCGL